MYCRPTITEKALLFKGFIRIAHYEVSYLPKSWFYFFNLMDIIFCTCIVLFFTVVNITEHLRTKLIPDFHLTYSKNGGNLGSGSK